MTDPATATTTAPAGAGRLPPHSFEAEQALLGSLLIDRDAIVKIADTLPPDALYDGRHRWIYRAMRHLWENRTPIDFLTLTELLQKHRKLDAAGGYAYVVGLMSAVPTAVHAEYYAEIIIGHARRRAMIDACADLVKSAWDADLGLDDAIGQLRRSVEPYLPPAGIGGEHGLIADLIDEHSARVVDRWSGRAVDAIVPTGMPKLDRAMNGGLRPGDLCYLGSRPGMGKTSAALQIALHAARTTGKTVVISELEMSSEALLNRMIASEARLKFALAYQTIGDLAEQDLWLQAADRLASVPIDIQCLRTTDAIRSHVERAAAANPVWLVIIDHIGIVADKIRDESASQRMAEISHRCKRLAIQLGVPVLVLSQLNREVETHPPFFPSLHNLKHSGAIEEDADYALLLYRRKYYVDNGMLDPDDRKDYLPASNRHRVELMVAKNRNGEVCSVPLGWAPESMSFHPEAAA